MNPYKLARRYQDARVLVSGDPKRIANRGANKIIGRSLARAGLWRRLWRG